MDKVTAQTIIENAANWQAENPEEASTVFACRYPNHYGTALEAVAKLRRSGSLEFSVGQRVQTKYGVGTVVCFYTFVDGETPMKEEYEWVHGATNMVEVDLEDGHTWPGSSQEVMMSVDDVSPEPEFKREERYLVVKLSDFHTKQDEEAVRGWLRKFGVPTRQCVVVEHDWPIYEEVWDMVRRLAEGRSQKVAALAAQNIALKDCVSASYEFPEDPEFVSSEEYLNRLIAEKQAEILNAQADEFDTQGEFAGFGKQLRERAAEILSQAIGTTCPDEGCPNYGTAHAHLDSRADPDEVSRAWRSSTIDPKEQPK